MLKELGMTFPASWDDLYIKVAQYKATHGSIHGISKSADDPILAAWIARQDEVLSRHLQGKGTRLTDDQAIKLLALGINGGRGGDVALGGGEKFLAVGKTEASRDFDERWNAMYSKLQEFKVRFCRHGSALFHLEGY